ncbi:MAG: hypothetical protein KAS62_10130, partial [Candidatus Delongbacteria bacterium]|nr:hypothetical protein [Candidatus Delongbacteria bacterium]
MKKVIMLIVSLMILMSCSDESITGPTNNAPVIISLTANPMSVQQNDSSVITCFASDADEDSLTYSWDKTGGTIDGSGSSITWIAPNTIEAHTITCTVSDGEATDTRSININSTNNGSIFLFNGLGDVGTLSIIDNDGQIANDVMNVGKWPNHISEDGGTLYVVNSGNNNIQMINASNNENMGSIELTAYSNPMRSVVCNG